MTVTVAMRRLEVHMIESVDHVIKIHGEEVMSVHLDIEADPVKGIVEDLEVLKENVPTVPVESLNILILLQTTM
uniref:Uncharacterized protein n=1 Tax=Ciona intestinalis TaxID=7719 RepID=H2XZY2_CIOIN